MLNTELPHMTGNSIPRHNPRDMKFILTQKVVHDFTINNLYAKLLYYQLTLINRDASIRISICIIKIQL